VFIGRPNIFSHTLMKDVRRSLKQSSDSHHLKIHHLPIINNIRAFPTKNPPATRYSQAEGTSHLWKK